LAGAAPLVVGGFVSIGRVGLDVVGRGADVPVADVP
jgi:hypothetical protein